MQGKGVGVVVVVEVGVGVVVVGIGSFCFGLRRSLSCGWSEFGSNAGKHKTTLRLNVLSCIHLRCELSEVGRVWAVGGGSLRSRDKSGTERTLDRKSGG